MFRVIKSVLELVFVKNTFKVSVFVMLAVQYVKN